jgi:hypothetical protein
MQVRFIYRAVACPRTSTLLELGLGLRNAQLVLFGRSFASAYWWKLGVADRPSKSGVPGYYFGTFWAPNFAKLRECMERKYLRIGGH